MPRRMVREPGTVGEERDSERLRVYHNLMNQAREDLAYKQAGAIRDDLVNEGKTVPPAVIAAYRSGLMGYHARELMEMQRDREERFLAVLLQVDRSRRPFSDEPGIEFPTPAAIRSLTRDRYDNWSDFSKNRIERYAVTSFGAAMPKRALELRDLLAKVVKFGGYDDPKTTLAEAIAQLQLKYDLNISVNEKAFKFDQVMDVAKTEIAVPTPIPEMKTTLSTVLKRILARIPAPSGATYIIRRDEIEITTGQFALGEKTVRTYPVADLVTPIATPGAFQQQNAINNFQPGSIIGGLGARPSVLLGAPSVSWVAALGGQLGSPGWRSTGWCSSAANLGSRWALWADSWVLAWRLSGSWVVTPGALGPTGWSGWAALGGQLGGRLGGSRGPVGCGQRWAANWAVSLELSVGLWAVSWVAHWAVSWVLSLASWADSLAAVCRTTTRVRCLSR